jgi:hypothetical protein
VSAPDAAGDARPARNARDDAKPKEYTHLLIASNI